MVLSFCTFLERRIHMNEQTSIPQRQCMKKTSRLPRYLPLPYYLLTEQLSPTALLVYGLILGRTTLSQKNNMTDADGNIYVIYTTTSLAKELHRSEVSIRNAKRELIRKGLLIQKEPSPGEALHLYPLIPVETEGESFLLPPETNLSPPPQKKYHRGERKFTPNYISNNKINYTYQKGESL